MIARKSILIIIGYCLSFSLTTYSISLRDRFKNSKKTSNTQTVVKETPASQFFDMEKPAESPSWYNPLGYLLKNPLSTIGTYTGNTILHYSKPENEPNLLIGLGLLTLAWTAHRYLNNDLVSKKSLIPDWIRILYGNTKNALGYWGYDNLSGLELDTITRKTRKQEIHNKHNNNNNNQGKNNFNYYKFNS